MRNIDRLYAERQRSFRRFRNFIIALQVAVVVSIVWLLTHPEAIGSWFGRLLAGIAA